MTSSVYSILISDPQIHLHTIGSFSPSITSMLVLQYANLWKKKKKKEELHLSNKFDIFIKFLMEFQNYFWILESVN